MGMLGRTPLRCRCCERRFYVPLEREEQHETAEATADE